MNLDVAISLALIGIAILAVAIPYRPRTAPVAVAKTKPTTNPENGVVVSLEHYRNGNRQYLN